jgi:hypothetical protein
MIRRSPPVRFRNGEGHVVRQPILCVVGGEVAQRPLMERTGSAASVRSGKP